MPFDSQELVHLESADGAIAQIHQHGAHLVNWWPAGATQNRLFISALAEVGPGKAIRGGVPVIFPQFANLAAGPKHGFARSTRWRLAAHGQRPEGLATARFALTEGDASHATWPHPYFATLEVTVGGRDCAVSLLVANMGKSDFSFTGALHTYLAVADIAHTRVLGLTGCDYRDSAAGGGVVRDTAPVLSFEGEVDRIYLATPNTLTLADGARPLTIEQAGFSDTVVWNPGCDKAPLLKDLQPGDWQRFVCVEAAQIQWPITLAAGGVWRGRQTLRA